MKPAPNPAPPVDGGIPLQLHIQRAWPSATEEHRWAGGAVAKANQPQRGDMFIAQPNRNLRKPRRGGMVSSRTGHAAPTGEWRLHKAIECENHWAFEAFCKAK